MARKVIIIGAAGRDFHNFNTFFRDNDLYDVKAFTAAQIPDIDGRKYPPELAGKLYPEGIPIHPEEELTSLIRDLDIDDCIFSYSDVPYGKVMAVSAVVNTAGANFVLLGGKETMLRSAKPVIAVGAVRTGCGKSQTSRRIIEILMEEGLKVVAIRHPMPYGDLVAQKVQRYASLNDLENMTAPWRRWKNMNLTWSGGMSSMPGLIMKPSSGRPRMILTDATLFYGTGVIMISRFIDRT